MIYFITEDWIKENSSITENVDMKDVLPLIKSAADMWTRSTLGTYFYKYLLTKFNAQTLSTIEAELVEDYIKYAIAWRASADAVIELTYKLTNKGTQIQSGEYSDSPEFRAIGFVAKHKTQKAEFYENRLYEYLKQNKDLFPQLTDKQNFDSNVKKCFDQNNFSSGVHII